MTTFFEKKSFYNPCSNFVTVVNKTIKSFHSLYYLWVTKLEIIISTIPYTKNRSFVTRKKVTPRLIIISKNFDRDMHLFINFVSIPRLQR